MLRSAGKRGVPIVPRSVSPAFSGRSAAKRPTSRPSPYLNAGFAIGSGDAIVTAPSASVYSGMLHTRVPQTNTMSSATGAPSASTIVARTEPESTSIVAVAVTGAVGARFARGRSSVAVPVVFRRITAARNEQHRQHDQPEHRSKAWHAAAVSPERRGSGGRGRSEAEAAAAAAAPPTHSVNDADVPAQSLRDARVGGFRVAPLRNDGLQPCPAGNRDPPSGTGRRS